MIPIGCITDLYIYIYTYTHLWVYHPPSTHPPSMPVSLHPPTLTKDTSAPGFGGGRGRSLCGPSARPSPSQRGHVQSIWRPSQRPGADFHINDQERGAVGQGETPEWATRRDQTRMKTHIFTGEFFDLGASQTAYDDGCTRDGRKGRIWRFN